MTINQSKRGEVRGNTPTVEKMLNKNLKMKRIVIILILMVIVLIVNVKKDNIFNIIIQKHKKKEITVDKLNEKLQTLYEIVEKGNNLSNKQPLTTKIPDEISIENGTYYINYDTIFEEYDLEKALQDYLIICDVVQRSGATIEGYFKVLDSANEYIKTYGENEYTNYCKMLIQTFSKEYFGLGDLFVEGEMYSLETIEEYHKVINTNTAGDVKELTERFYKCILENSNRRNANVIAKGIELNKIMNGENS